MSKIAFCTQGGLDGVLVDSNEMKEFARIHNKRYIDQFIPLPPPDDIRQVAIMSSKSGCPTDHNDPENTTYWENEKGSHGWCCSVCGEVVQWG